MISVIEDEHTCETVPDGIRIYHSRIGGNLVAECEECRVLFGYWECACDFYHECVGV